MGRGVAPSEDSSTIVLVLTHTTSCEYEIWLASFSLDKLRALVPSPFVAGSEEEGKRPVCASRASLGTWKQHLSPITPSAGRLSLF